MGIRGLLRQFGGWTTIQRWSEPVWCRVWLKSDGLARLLLAIAVGSVMTAILLSLFAINVNPPHPLFALFGMLIFGGLTFMLLFQGESTASGKIRLCEEGICRKRFYVGLSAQWSEDASWPYEQIQRCELIQGRNIGQSFSLLLIYTGPEVDLIVIPERIDLKEVVRLLTAKGVAVQAGSVIPPAFTKALPLPVGIASAALGAVLVIVATGFYLVKAGFGADEEVAATVDENALMQEPLAAEPVPQPAPEPASAPSSPVPFPPEAAPQVVPNIGITPPALRPPSANPFDVPGVIVHPPEGATPPPAATPNSSSDARQAELVGGSGGFAFELISRQRQPVIGFRYGMGSWAGKQALSRFEPIFERNSSAEAAENVILAKEGYVVSGLDVAAESLVHGVRVHFARQTASGELEKSDTYSSDWIGEHTNDQFKTISTTRGAVLGIRGRRGAVIDAIGLVFE